MHFIICTVQGHTQLFLARKIGYSSANSPSSLTPYVTQIDHVACLHLRNDLEGTVIGKEVGVSRGQADDTVHPLC